MIALRDGPFVCSDFMERVREELRAALKEAEVAKLVEEYKRLAEEVERLERDLSSSRNNL